MRSVLCVCLLALPLLAQFPGQYPTGPFPGGGGRGRNPNGTGTNGTGREQPPDRRTSRDKGKAAPIVTTTEGLLRRAESGQIVIEAEDHRIIWYHLPAKMIY